MFLITSWYSFNMQLPAGYTEAFATRATRASVGPTDTHAAASHVVPPRSGTLPEHRAPHSSLGEPRGAGRHSHLGQGADGPAFRVSGSQWGRAPPNPAHSLTLPGTRHSAKPTLPRCNSTPHSASTWDTPTHHMASRWCTMAPGPPHYPPASPHQLPPPPLSLRRDKNCRGGRGLRPTSP